MLANLSTTFVCSLIPFVMFHNFYQRIYVGDLCIHFSFYFICMYVLCVLWDSCQRNDKKNRSFYAKDFFFHFPNIEIYRRQLNKKTHTKKYKIRCYFFLSKKRHAHFPSFQVWICSGNNIKQTEKERVTWNHVLLTLLLIWLLFDVCFINSKGSLIFLLLLLLLVWLQLLCAVFTLSSCFFIQTIPCHGYENITFCVCLKSTVKFSFCVCVHACVRACDLWEGEKHKQKERERLKWAIGMIMFI